MIVKQFLIGVDQTLNTLIKLPGDGYGWADETLSARAFRCFLQERISDRLYRVIDRLFYWQSAHCYESWKSEYERAQLPSHYREGKQS
jgi:hypothetical protein